MKITDVRIRRLVDNESIKGVASITFDDEFVVHDIKIIDGQNGLFVAMPSKKVGDAGFRDIAHPLSSEVRNRIKDAVLSAYEDSKEEE
ncbi:MAG: septation regulator SpoVG [Clostridia bacterium]|nr:septation regulator SpoVG [Clostridia bacterium]